MTSADRVDGADSWVEADTATTIASRFREQVARAPERIAIADGNRSIRYDELDSWSDSIAAAIAGSDTRGAGARVGLLLPHGSAVVAAVLGVVKCGLVAAPLSPSDPAPRLRSHRELVDPALVLVDPAHVALAESAGFEPDQLIVVADPDSSAAVNGVADGDEPDRPAVLIMTSGSTGRPKAVRHSHRTLLHNVMRYNNGLGLSHDDRIAWHAPVSGGQGLVTMFGALLDGVTLCPFPLAERGAAGFSSWLCEAGVTVIDTLPSVLRHLSATLRAGDLAGIRLVRIASEPAYRADLVKFRAVFPPGCQLVHVLASAETGIIAQHVCDDADLAASGAGSGRLAVGHPVPGVDVQLLDADGHPVGDGEVGEVVVRSRYLSLGYWHGEETENARFTTDGDSRSFHTSDLAIWTTAGLVMQGRGDLQVKVRGQRVQLDEVESVLLSLDGVAAAAVQPVTTDNGDTRLVAHVVAEPDAAVTMAGLRSDLASRLQATAVPTRFELVDALPLTTTGKVDRRALAASAPETGAEPPTAGPSDELTDRVARLWEQAFAVEPHDRHTGFLQLGGDSLLAAVLGALIYDELDVMLDMAFFRSDPSIEDIAARIEQGDAAADRGLDPLPPLRPAPPAVRGTLSFTQLAMWKTSAQPELATRNNVAVPYRIRGEPDVNALHAGIDDVVRRHEILRTTFAIRADKPHAAVQPPYSVELPVSDLRDDSDATRTAADLLVSEAEPPFDLATGPLIRWRLVRLGDLDWQLHRINHHLIADTWSWQVFLDDLGRRYEAELAGAPPDSHPPALQHADYAAWERRVFAPDAPRTVNEVDWWATRLAGWDGGGRRRFTPFRTAVADADADPDDDAATTGSVRHWGIPAKAADRIDEVARDVGATYFDSRVALTAALLGLTTGLQRLAIGTQVTARRRTELQSMIGPLMNRVVLPLEFEPTATLREWLGVVHEVVTEVGAHSAIPRHTLMTALRARGLELPAEAMLFQARYPLPTLRFGGLEVDALPRRCVSPGQLEVGVTRLGEAAECWAAFNPQRYVAADVAQFLDDIAGFADTVGAAPDQPMADLWP